MTKGEEYWPFEMAKHEQGQEAEFLEAAFREGFAPHRFHGDSYGAASPAGRAGYLIVRGPRRWEVWLGAGGQKVGSLFVADFRLGSEALLKWLRGENLEPIEASAAEGLVTPPFQRGERAPTAPRLIQ